VLGMVSLFLEIARLSHWLF